MIHFETINKTGDALAEKIKSASLSFQGEAIVFIGALGICVRKILPIVRDKYTDPAVVCVDTTGRFVIPVLSGHVGGANNLARQIADITGGTAVITTQSDNLGLWALDTLAKEYRWGMQELSREEMNRVIALFVNKEPTALLMDIEDDGTEYLRNSLPPHVTIVNDANAITSSEYGLAIIVSYKDYTLDIPCIKYIPRCLHAGIGLAHQAQPAEEVISEIFLAIKDAGVHQEAIKAFCTIDIKSEEPVVKALQSLGYTFHFYSAEQLSGIDVPNPSETVNKHVGTPSVSEAAAMMNNATLILPKQKSNNWTIAISLIPSSAAYSVDDGASVTVSLPLTGRSGWNSGHIEIVGAGPGDPELVSVRGKRFLETADLILYAGSLVPKELTYYAKRGCIVRSSADMNLEEQFQLMKEFYDKGKLVVRLHTGDPCIYGAIQEQMAFFDRYNMDYHITPGISSFLAAAAELRSQFTIPEKCQSIILTRGEGRTPMPEKEKLQLLASHQSTMCIFLSASIVDEVQRQLLEGGYSPETPVAACYKLTWKDQKIYRGKLKDLADILHSNNLTLTTMIVVGDAIDNRQGLSKLYDGHFTHMFREGK